MALFEVHLHDAEFTFAPFSSTDTRPTDTAGGEDSEESDSLYFPNDEDTDSGGTGFKGVLVLVVLVLAAVAIRKLLRGGDDLEDFADESD